MYFSYAIWWEVGRVGLVLCALVSITWAWFVVKRLELTNTLVWSSKHAKKRSVPGQLYSWFVSLNQTHQYCGYIWLFPPMVEHHRVLLPYPWSEEHQLRRANLHVQCKVSCLILKCGYATPHVSHSHDTVVPISSQYVKNTKGGES